jgi:DEAD/DEAH box helicase domain-containing protein
VRRRIDWEIWSEYTLDARIGRTLEKTGCSTVEIIPELFDQAAEQLLATLRNELGGLRDLDSVTLGSFLEEIFQQLKNKGGIEHPDLDAYLESKGNYYKLGNRMGRLHRPPVGQSSRIPVFLISDSGTRFSHPGPKTWHEVWLKKCFGAIDGNASRFTTEIYRNVLRELVTAGIFFEKTVGHARIWGLRREALGVTRSLRTAVAPISY